MDTVKASCPLHGEVTVPIAAVQLHICANVDDQSYYTFPCDTCGQVTKPACHTVVSILVSGGVRPHTFRVPAEALELHTGPALTNSDLADFTIDLHSSDLLAADAGGAA